MKLEDIKALWKADSQIDHSKLDVESTKGPQLHAKYYEFYIQERLVLRKMRGELKKLELDKWKFLTEGPTQDQHEKGWALPARGKILKTEVVRYLEADFDLQEFALRVDHQDAKVDYLYSIIDTIGKRGYAIKNAIDFIRWQGGY